MAGFAIKLDITQVVKAADALSRVSVDELADAMVFAINGTLDKAYELSERRMLSGINLTEQYVESRLETTEATRNRPVGQIAAPIGRKYLTNLSHYDPQQLNVPVNWTNAYIEANHGFSPWPGWTKRTGAQSIGIAADRKASGRSVSVVRGQRKRVATAFAIPGKKDSEGNNLMFRRSRGTEKIEALLGPSVYQLFRIAAGEIEDQVGDEFESAVVEEANKVLNKILDFT